MTDERFFESELYRLRGELLFTVGRRADGEAELQRGLAIARQQQARWWELRAARSLAKHWHEEGKNLEAYSLLQPAYSWFVEGLDTRDLKDAKGLLDELSKLHSVPQNSGRLKISRRAVLLILRLRAAASVPIIAVMRFMPRGYVLV